MQQKNRTQRGPTKKSSKTALEGDIRWWFHPYTIFLYHWHGLRYSMCFRDPAQLGGQILRSGTAGGIEISLDWWDIMIWFQFLTYFQDILYKSYIHIRLVIPIFEAPNWATKTPTSVSVRIALASPICSSTPPWSDVDASPVFLGHLLFFVKHNALLL